MGYGAMVSIGGSNPLDLGSIPKRRCQLKIKGEETMEVSIDRESIREIEEIIIPSFVGYYASRCTDVTAIMLALQAIIEKVDEVKKHLEND